MWSRLLGTAAPALAVLMLTVTSASANTALEFFADAADSAIAPDSDSLDIAGKAFTMEAWIMATGPQNGDGIIINKEDSYEMALRAGDTFMFALQAGAWDWFGGGKPTMNEWHHVAVTYDGELSQGWIDGAAAPAPTEANTLDMGVQASPFQVGRRVCCGTTPFLGVIDEVRVSDIVRYTKDFDVQTREFETDANTRVLWHFNEGSGIDIADDSGNGNNGELEGGPQWTAGAPIGAAAIDARDRLAVTWSALKTPY
ncbi:LamG domain-containing protein [Candidatus Poribacteria bacterium]|jgi:hypothetical protein|nr:LamG domain-containing protein [Candidatus Poribacteria bacterium]MBT5533994.1 LamG domain-containing protein [Candidatus Poribacteria bacterium]MBT5709953.1 LamG domain-containing protein [Candidatus Poribacteria bacterium]MBT7808215.1 LamG domain-containing protein [Candidatus Poribacteria bacterium]